MRSFANIALVLAITAFVGTVAYVLSSRQDEQFESVGRLAFPKGVPPALQILGPQFGQPDTKEEIALATAAFDVNSFDVALVTAREHPILKMNAGQIAADVNAEPIRETLVVEVTARAKNGFVASVLAQAYIDSYFKVRKDRDVQRAREVRKVVAARLRALPRAERNGGRGIALRDQLASLDALERVGSPGPQVIEVPRPSHTPVLPRPKRDALFGMLFGLAVGAGLVALRTNISSRGDLTAARDSGAVAVGPAPPK